jgi:phosphoribosylanthranilate isomerase
MATHEPGPRTIVKICGLTRLEDARDALEAGADWLGFIVRGESPRRVDPSVAAGIVAAFPETVAVAVMVGVTPDEALTLARACGAARVQLHRVDPAGWPADFPLPVAFAVPVSGDGHLEARLPSPRDLALLDSADESRDGGTGRTFPWEAAVSLAARRPVMLAGGLGPDNVAAALERVRPFGVDASSRLEQAPGIKDALQVRRFVEAVRRYDARSQRDARTGRPA